MRTEAPLRHHWIFVHASPRSGSTYFFNVLRRNRSLLCFNQAITDTFRGANHKDGILGLRKSDALRFNGQRKDLNHGFLEKADLEEFVEARNAALHLFPKNQTFINYLPQDGVLQPQLVTYLAALIKYASEQDKHPALCEIYSRGRAGALRDHFGGFHIAQYRDPLSQFGSFVRLAVEHGWWSFLAFPLQELSSGVHPLYQLIPERWRPPILTRGSADCERWAADTHLNAIAASPRPDTIENLFRWHLFSWFLNNLAAISYSDLALDIETVHDDEKYRAAVTGNIASRIDVTLDLSDIKKFDRYYEFSSFDVTTVCEQVVSSIRALDLGVVESALRSLGKGPTTIGASAGLELLLSKLRASLASMAMSADRIRISSAEWETVVEDHWRPWFNRRVQLFVRKTYPIASAAMYFMRRTGLADVMSRLRVRHGNTRGWTAKSNRKSLQSRTLGT